MEWRLEQLLNEVEEQICTSLLFLEAEIAV